MKNAKKKTPAAEPGTAVLNATHVPPKRSLHDELRRKRQQIILEAQAQSRVIELALANLDAATHDAESVLAQ